MKRQSWLKLGGVFMGAFITGKVVKSFLPEHFLTPEMHSLQFLQVGASRGQGDLPAIELSFLRCGSIRVPEAVVVRGGSLTTPHVNALSAVLVRHPRGTFLYDTGLSTTVVKYLPDTPFLFRNTLARFAFEQSLHSHLQHLQLSPQDLDFVLLSHLHWDHVSGVPDLPGVRLLVNQVEYAAWQARLGMYKTTAGLVQNLLGDNPLELFSCDGPYYEGFRSSHDLFGDGSVILVPLPGHTPGNTGLFINRSNGSRLFLLGDAAWCSQNYLLPATMHPLIWTGVTGDDATARQTLIELHRFSQQHPDVPMIAMHDAEMQAHWMAIEQRTLVRV